MVKADGNKVVVKYDGDFSSAFVLNVLASRPASVVDAVTVQANEASGDMGNAWLKANSAGTGPFVLKAFRPAEIINLEANPNYFLGAPAIKGVIIRHVAEAATQQLLLESGDVDIAKNLTPDQIAGLAGKDTVKVETYPQAAVHFLSFNQKTEALQPEAVWEAARYLVDYKGMTDSPSSRARCRSTRRSGRPASPARWTTTRSPTTRRRPRRSSPTPASRRRSR